MGSWNNNGTNELEAFQERIPTARDQLMQLLHVHVLIMTIAHDYVFCILSSIENYHLFENFYQFLFSIF